MVLGGKPEVKVNKWEKNMFKKILLVIALSSMTLIVSLHAGTAYASSLVPVYRLYNPSIEQHLLTIDTNEYTFLLAQPAPNAWQSDASTFDAYPASNGVCQTGTEPIYRMYNRFLGDDHVFTADANEINYWTVLNPSSSWSNEGIAFCAYSTQVSGTVPVYRILRWDGKEHLLTTDQNEVNALVSRGWGTEENIAFYAVP